jgi:hypothetical protein
MPKFPSIIKNRYEILFFYEDPSSFINKNLNNQKEILNNQEGKNSAENIESITKSIIANTENNVGEIIVNSINNKKRANIKRIGNINNKKNINYLNNYSIYSKLSCFKLYFNYTDENSLMKRFNGNQEFNYIFNEQNSFFNKIFEVFNKVVSSMITDKHIKEFNEHINKLKLIFNNNINISKIKNLLEYKNLSNNEIEKKVEEEKINIINNIKKYKKYKDYTDEEISKIILEMLNKCDIINKEDRSKRMKNFKNKIFVNIKNEEKESIKNILKISKGTKISKEEYFESNIKNAFNKIRNINPNINYCLVIDIKKSLPYKLNLVDKEYNIQSGGWNNNSGASIVFLGILYLVGCIFVAIGGSFLLGLCVGLWPICLILLIYAFGGFGG